jgi:D-alanyl-lipoteichoic acid acyltransferase DltB (MBOAT superfamily)
MLFNSIDFVIFLAITLAVVRLGGIKLRNWLLLAASILFYGWWDPRYLALLGFNCAVAYVGGIAIDRASDSKKKRTFCTVCVLIAVGLLSFFKYRLFVFETVASICTQLHITKGEADLDWMLSWIGLGREKGIIKFILPVGISFYTFQAIAYVVDVCRGTTKACTNLRDFLLFKTFFPQLVAGPIERANNLLPQIQNPRLVTNADIIEGLFLVLWGFCKKVVIADNLALKIAPLFARGEFNTGDVLIGAIGFTFQAYGDFCGYTDIARGVSRWFGVNLMQNFNFPYYATSPQDFWRRWHISLGSWLREYLYIPLGGNRKGPFRTWLNLIITMLIGGLWHGPSWPYVIWGAYQGLILSLHRTWVAWRGEKRHSHLSRALCIGGNFFLTIYGMFIFRLASWEQIVSATASIFQFQTSPDFLVRFIKMLPYIFVILIIETPIFVTHNPWFWVRRRPIIAAAVFLVLFYLILILGVTGGDQFIYFAF